MSDDLTSAARDLMRSIDHVEGRECLSVPVATIDALRDAIPPHYSERSEDWREAYRIAYDVLSGEPGDELVDVVDSAITDYREARESMPDTDASDIAFEIADGAVPVYTYARMQVIACSIHVATYEVESGLMGEDSDMVTMAGVVICEIVRDCLSVVEREIESADDSDDDSEA